MKYSNDNISNAIDITKIPLPDKWDAAHAGTKALLSAITGIGGSAAEIFDYIVTPSIVKRRNKLVQSIGIRLVKLEQKGIIDIPSLVKDEAFITILLQAFQIGLRNHREEKLRAVQNIVLNSAIALDPEEDLKIHFLNLIDSMTALHLLLFVYSNDSVAWVNSDPSMAERLAEKNPERSPQVPIAWIFPELEGQEDFVNTIFKDLRDMNLLLTAPIYDMLESGTSKHNFTTDFGQKFLASIATPIELEEDTIHKSI